MKKIVILTYGNFPNGEAASVRIYALAKIFLHIGFEVNIISMSRENPMIWKEYKDVKYISIRSRKNDYIGRAKNIILYVNRVKKVLKEINDITVLMPLSLPIAGLLYCEKYAKKRNIVLLTDRTEWYSPSEFSLGRFSPQFIQNALTNRIIIDKYWKVISISRYLEKYYQNKGIQTTRIPAIMDVRSMEANRMQSNVPRIIVYAGSPAKKDSLSMIISAFSQCDSKKRILHVYGLTEKQFDSANPEYRRKKKNVVFHGRVSREEVLSALKNADFTTVFRDPNERFAKAGFPSKVAESLSSGTPTITNMTSDLELYLNNNNSLIVDNYSTDSYLEAIKKIDNLSIEELNFKKKNARETAERYFDYSAYIKDITVLLLK